MCMACKSDCFHICLMHAFLQLHTHTYNKFTQYTLEMHACLFNYYDICIFLLHVPPYLFIFLNICTYTTHVVNYMIDMLKYVHISHCCMGSLYSIWSIMQLCSLLERRQQGELHRSASSDSSLSSWYLFCLTLIIYVLLRNNECGVQSVQQIHHGWCNQALKCWETARDSLVTHARARTHHYLLSSEKRVIWRGRRENPPHTHIYYLLSTGQTLAQT